jgi:hypothetical protein
MTTWRGSYRSSASRIFGLVVVAWLVVGLVAAVQRHDFSRGAANCSKVATVAVTILVGPFNYAGTDPKVGCHVPQPSK